MSKVIVYVAIELDNEDGNAKQLWNAVQNGDCELDDIIECADLITITDIVDDKLEMQKRAIAGFNRGIEENDKKGKWDTLRGRI